MADGDSPPRVAWVTGASRGVDLSASQSPEGVGRVIAALAGDPEVLSMTGQALAVKALAARYDVDASG